MRGRAGRCGSSWGSRTDDLSLNCSNNRARARAKKTQRHKSQAISAAEGPDRGQASQRGAVWEGPELLQPLAFMLPLQCHILDSEYVRRCQFNEIRQHLIYWILVKKNIKKHIQNSTYSLITLLYLSLQGTYILHTSLKKVYTRICNITRASPIL